MLVNARQLRHVPGRKTDLNDCQWLQRLHRSGLLRGSFRPSDAITRLRALPRQMGNLTQQRRRCVQWIQQAPAQANVLVHRRVAEHAGALQRGVAAADTGEPDLPERGELRAADPGARGRAARALAGW